MDNFFSALIQYQAFMNLASLGMQMGTSSTSIYSESSENIPNQKKGFVPVKRVEIKKQKLTLTKEDLSVASSQINKKPWTEEEDILLKKYVQEHMPWSQIPKLIQGRNQKMCYSRYRRLSLEAKQYWKKAQDDKILELVQKYGESWREISVYFKERSAKQIRQHYLNFLKPNIKKDEWTVEQDMKIVQFINTYGKKWKYFQNFFGGRTENQIKNRYYGRLKKLMMKKQKKRAYKY